jgi:hypothetical protein
MSAPDGARLAFVDNRAVRFCVRCGLALEPPWWMTVFPNGEHERCRDWTGRPFPFERHHDLLRKIARHLDDARRRDVLAIAHELAKLARTWPRDALVTLDASRMHIAAARPLVQGAPNKLTAQL